MILVIDDNPGFSRVLSRMLEKAGYQVRLAMTADIGLGLLCDAARDGEPYELAIIDYQLDGGVNGVTLAHQARERGSVTKFVLISGEFADAASAQHLDLDDFEEVIGKPILATAMVEMVNRYTGRNMSLPIPAEITEAAAAAGLDLAPAPASLAEEDRTG